MNTEDMMISTLPIKPQHSTNIGMMLAPTIMDYIGTVFKIEKNIGFNILHSYDNKEEELKEYLKYIYTSGIQYDSIFIDRNHADKLLKIIEEMFYDKHLIVKSKEILRCDCGRVDMIYSKNNNARLYSIKDGKPYCNFCGKECCKYDEKVLVFEIKSKVKDLSLVPTFLKKEMNRFSIDFTNTELLVSKFRNTGYTLSTKQGKFNIDIDFLWMNYFKLFNKTMQIYIASNHQLFPMYLMDYISKTTSNKKLTFIASPYIECDLNKAKEQYELRNLSEYKKLLLLYNLKWNNKNCIWSDSNSRYLNNISNTKLKNLYKSMVISAQDLINNNFFSDELIYEILSKQTNMQNNIKIMKKMYNEKRI